MPHSKRNGEVKKKKGKFTNKWGRLQSFQMIFRCANKLRQGDLESVGRPFLSCWCHDINFPTTTRASSGHVVTVCLCAKPSAFYPLFSFIFTTPGSRYFREYHFRRRKLTQTVNNVPKVTELGNDAVKFWTVLHVTPRCGVRSQGC